MASTTLDIVQAHTARTEYLGDSAERSHAKQFNLLAKTHLYSLVDYVESADRQAWRAEGSDTSKLPGNLTEAEAQADVEHGLRSPRSPSLFNQANAKSSAEAVEANTAATEFKI